MNDSENEVGVQKHVLERLSDSSPRPLLNEQGLIDDWVSD
jgi:hypothetical protein